MTTDKARKRAVRTRMTKTGESYTAARRQVVGAQPEAEPPEAGPPQPRPSATEPVSDDAIRRATGRGWDDWYRILDQRGVAGFSHRDTAAWLVAEHGIGGWWAQSVTVGFERARGLRAVNQTTGGFSVSASRTIGVPVDALYRALVDDAERDRWLPPGTLRLRTATPHRTARFDVGDGPSRLAVGFTAKGPDRAMIAIQHERLAGPADVEVRRDFWRAALDRLEAMLTGS